MANRFNPCPTQLFLFFDAFQKLWFTLECTGKQGSLMKKWYTSICSAMLLLATAVPVFSQTAIRFNRLGFEPRESKMIVVASKNPSFRPEKINLVNLVSGTSVPVKLSSLTKDYGRFGPFVHSYRLDISANRIPGKYQLVVNDSIKSDTILIAHDVYHGIADFALGFLREQRCGNEPASFDSAHQTNDFIIGRNNMPLNLSGGWHNVANDQQEMETAAIISGYMLAAYRDFPFVFNDNYDTYGRPARNGRADVLDEGKWGLDWLLKMHPSKDLLFTRVGNNVNPLIPPATSLKSEGRPAILLADSSSNAASVVEATTLLSTVFANGFSAFNDNDPLYASRLKERAFNTYEWASRYSWKLGSEDPAYTGMASASAALGTINPDNKYRAAFTNYSNKIPGTVSSARGIKFLFAGDNPNCSGKKALLLKWKKLSEQNAFHYGDGFLSNSNYQLVTMAIEALHYRQECNDSSYQEMEQATLDWLLGNNPWGVVMLTNLAAKASASEVYPPASNHLSTGGLVNGPVSETIYKQSQGASLLEKDELESWQSSLAVYHNDEADYATNMPMEESTAAMIYLLASRENASLGHAPNGMQMQDGAIVRGDSSTKKIALVFIGMPPGKGAKGIAQVLSREKIRSSFFLPSQFLKQNGAIARQLKAGRHYIGAAGSQDWWNDPNMVNITQAAFENSMQENRQLLKAIGVDPVIRLSPNKKLNYLYNCDGDGKTWLINPTKGTMSLTTNMLPGEQGYVNSDSIFQDIMAKARQMPYGLNGYFLVIPTDAPAERTDKFYMLLPLLLQDLKNEGYRFVGVDEMLGLAVPKVAPPPRKKAISKKKKRRHK